MNGLSEHLPDHVAAEVAQFLVVQIRQLVPIEPQRVQDGRMEVPLSWHAYAKHWLKLKRFDYRSETSPRGRVPRLV